MSKRDSNYLTAADDARIPRGVRIRTLRNGEVSYKRWFLPLSWGHLTLSQAYDYLGIVGAPQGKIPEVIRWTEGKDSHLVKQFFYGGVDLRAHDYIHLLLGRGLLPKDEAFVIGFTMGTTNRLESMNKETFAYIAKNYYPNAYQMDDASKQVFLDAAMLGYISDCPPLDQVDFAPLLDLSIDEARKRLNIRASLLHAYYTEIEQQRYPGDCASQRLAAWMPSGISTWLLDPGDSERTVIDAVCMADEAFNLSDQEWTPDLDLFEMQLNASYVAIKEHLEEQRGFARLCFVEIDQVLKGEDSHAQKDIEEARWDDFYLSALENVEESRRLIEREVHHAAWEGYENETRELRNYVHVLLGRGASPRDRAFCRGFFHGSCNRRTTYANELKLDLMSKIPISRDGLYSEDMIQSYQDGARLGFISDCPSLAELDFSTLHEMTVVEARESLNLRTILLARYLSEVENRRLIL